SLFSLYLPLPFSCVLLSSSFFFTAAAPTATYTLSLHDALPICAVLEGHLLLGVVGVEAVPGTPAQARPALPAHRPPVQDHEVAGDRKSTRLNSSHVKISYAVFCLKKKKKQKKQT